MDAGKNTKHGSRSRAHTRSWTSMQQQMYTQDLVCSRRVFWT